RPHAVVFGKHNDVILVFAVGTDHALWTKAFRSGAWEDWTTLGHRLASPPCAVVFQRETFMVFAIGIDSAIWYTTGGQWHSLGGTFKYSPFALSTSSQVHLFATDSHSALQHRIWDGSSWNDWESLGGILMSAPTANAFEYGLPHVFGLGTD